ncbi:hypothetical protein [Geoalkalibacter sp.]|uniref:hypothetical protein n=1 Tax=Geoalkalibacter sp. TaxID=3041440 RepID=UPI00272EDD62|nr:hypothetical protein [Geoalkalibacter sp.]
MGQRWQSKLGTVRWAARVGGMTVLVLLILGGAGCAPKAPEVYSPQEWLEMFKAAGGWVPLPFPDSKYRPGSIIQVDANGIRWIDHLESCRFPEEVLRPEPSIFPQISFTKARELRADALINIKGISAGPAFSKVKKVSLEVQEHGADAFRLLNMKVWLEDPDNRAKVSAVCQDELAKPNRFLVTEAFRVSKGVYTLHDATGAAIKLKTPALGSLLKFEPDVKYEVSGDGRLVIEQPVIFAVRRAVAIGSNFEILGPSAAQPETADAQIEKLFRKASRTD